MPVFEYKCRKCGHKFEKLVFGQEKVKCPNCESKDVKKLISGFNIGGKGSLEGGGDSCSGGVCPICK